MTSEINAGDWKEGVVRMESDPDKPPRPSSISKADQVSAEVSDQARSTSRMGNSGPRRFPRIGLDALFHESRPSPGEEPNEDGSHPLYKVYKRRWFGVVQLTLLNIIVSWDVSLCPSFHASLACLNAERLACNPSHMISTQ